MNYYERSRADVIQHLGGRCNHCGFNDSRALQIDHVYGGGSKETKRIHAVVMHRKILSDTSGMYQLLCANCNWIKRHTHSECLRNRPKLALYRWFTVDNMDKVREVQERKQAIARLHALVALMK